MSTSPTLPIQTARLLIRDFTEADFDATRQLHIAGANAYLATQHWHSRAAYDTALAAQRDQPLGRRREQCGVSVSLWG